MDAEHVDAGTAGAAGERGALRLQDAAARHGAHLWVERRLFELTGSWAAAPGLPDDARVLLFEASASHAWHAELWEARLPVLAGIDRRGLARPPGGAVAPLLVSLERGSFDGDDRTAGRRFLVGLARVVLPLLLLSYRRFGQRLVPVADGPSLRALSLVVGDEEEEMRAVEAVVEALLEVPEAVRQAAEWTRELGEPVRSGGDDDGLLPWSEADCS